MTILEFEEILKRNVDFKKETDYSNIFNYKIHDDRFLPINEKLKRFYACYKFDTTDPNMLLTESVDKKYFSKKIQYFDKNKQSALLYLDDLDKSNELNMQFIKYCIDNQKQMNDISVFENFFNAKCKMQKILYADCPQNIKNIYIQSLKAEADIEAITENYISQSDFYAFYYCTIDSTDEYALIFVSSNDNINILNHFIFTPTHLKTRQFYQKLFNLIQAA